MFLVHKKVSEKISHDSVQIKFLFWQKTPSGCSCMKHFAKGVRVVNLGNTGIPSQGPGFDSCLGSLTKKEHKQSSFNERSFSRQTLKLEKDLIFILMFLSNFFSVRYLVLFIVF